MIHLGRGACVPLIKKSEQKWKLDKYGDGPGEMRKPFGICFLPNGNVAISDTYNYKVQVIDRYGKHVSTIGKHHINPRGVASTKYGEVAVADADNGCIHIFNADGRGIIRSFGQGLFTHPCGITVNEDNTFFVTDTKDQFISIHDSDGTQRSRIEYTAPPSLSNPISIATNKKGHIYISDENEGCIKMYSYSGELLDSFSGYHGSQEDSFNHQSGICIDGMGNLIVCDTGNHRVTMLQPNGKFIKHLLTMDGDHIYEPWQVATDDEGHIALTFWEGCYAACFYVFDL